MNKKTLVKVIASVLACMGFALISNHMPEFMQTVYQAVFGEFDHIALFFVSGLFVIEIIVLRKWGKDVRCRYFCLAMAVIAAFLVLFKAETNYTDRLAPGANTTLIHGALLDENMEESRRRIVFAEYYFEGRKITVPEREQDNGEHQYIYTMAVPKSRVIVGQESAVSEEAAEVILSYPFRQFGSDYFVLDEFWEHTDNIIMTAWEDGHIFCSKELLDAVLNHADDVILSGEGIDLLSYAEKGFYREAKQIFIILLLMLIGAVIVLPLWGRDYLYLSLFLSLPVGAAVWCIACVVFMAFGIPYHIITVLVGTVLGVGIRLFRQRNKFNELDKTACFDFMLLAVMATAFFACFKIFNMVGDAFSRCIFAYHMVNFGSMRDIFEEVAPYGMLEPMIMSMGYLFKCDAVYVFYPLMLISSIGIMCAGLYYVVEDRQHNYMSMTVFGAGMLLLITNFDYVISGFSMSVQGPTSVYFLIFFVFIVLKRQINIEKFEWIVVLAAAVIFLTRIEGAVYVMFFLAVSLGLENEFLKMSKVIMAVAGTVTVWNVFQMIAIGKNGSPMFWTPERGVLLIVGALLVGVMARLIKKPWPWLDYVKKHYFLLLASGVCLATIILVVFAKRDLGAVNLQIYLSHFSNNERMNGRINAGAIWTFVLLMCPIVIRNGSQLAKYTASVIVGYIILIYFICLFREGAPLHYGHGDSARRTLEQIMPTAVWLLSYTVGERGCRIRIK